MNECLRKRITYRRSNTDIIFSSEEKKNALYKSRLRTKKRKLMNKRNKIALCSSKNSDYDDQCLGFNKYGYCADLDGQNEDKICVGAHYYEREKTGSFIYKGIVSDIERKNDIYYILTLIEIPSLGLIEAGSEVPKVSPGGRGSYRYMYDVCKCSGIGKLNTSPTRGILYGS